MQIIKREPNRIDAPEIVAVEANRTEPGRGEARGVGESLCV